MTKPAATKPPSAKASRRTFLKRAGAATLIVVVGGSVYRAADRGVFSVGQGEAYEPWQNWREEQGSGPMALVQSAILAANPHNSQPWLFRVSEARLDLFADPSRNIGAIDPFLREMYTGLGCALENVVLTAQALGYRPQVQLQPEPENSAHAARIELVQGRRTPPSSITPSRTATRTALPTTRNALFRPKHSQL